MADIDARFPRRTSVKRDGLFGSKMTAARPNPSYGVYGNYDFAADRKRPGEQVRPALPGPLPKPAARSLSRCFADFLGKEVPGTDWGSVVIEEGLTWGGRRASTSPGKITFLDINDVKDRKLLFHELGHMPQWDSGRLTLPTYFKEAAAAWRKGKNWFDPQEVWKNTKVEQEADQWRDRMLTAYHKAGQPCG